ncbi:hypothetical protein AS594_35335 [Streptomyces agglomeratus]|uniref:Uncharacterized protein n=1 Tax=Streptomyces agglomeratus TaxID=285458 RepID=A0A1E5PHD2_9ACTN|nr:hypothetical protein [Streptomyces agglomeratus]OEJ28916.1 hypothetical protein AS594_35335 [Streptomyces agglomeratus]
MRGGVRTAHPSLASLYGALAEHEKAQAYPEAIEAAHADFAALHARSQGDHIPQPRHHVPAVNP